MCLLPTSLIVKTYSLGLTQLDVGHQYIQHCEEANLYAEYVPIFIKMNGCRFQDEWDHWG